MQDRRYTRKIAARRHLLGVLFLPARIHRHPGTESEGVLSRTLEVYLQVVVVGRICGSVLEQRCVFIDVVRNQIEVAVIIKIRIGCSHALEWYAQSPLS